MAITLANLADADAIKKVIDIITAVQAKHALVGARAQIRVINANGEQLVTSEELSGILGDSVYDTICSTALTSLNTALATLKSDQQDAFDAL